MEKINIKLYTMGEILKKTWQISDKKFKSYRKKRK